MSSFSMLEPAIVERIDAYWSADFACSTAELRGPLTRVQRHGPSLAGYPGICIFASHAAPLVSLPPSVFDALAERAARWSVEDVRDPERLAALIAPHTIERMIGPAFLGYTTHAPPQPTTSVRRLDATDAASIDDLRSACSPTEWEHGGMDCTQGVVFGAFDAAGALAALSGYKAWPQSLAHLYIVSRAAQRGKGLATQAVAAAARHAIASGFIAQYRTLEANAAALAIARKLGFERYGFTVALYFRK